MAKKRGYFRLSFKEVFSGKGRVDRMTFFLYNIVFNVISTGVTFALEMAVSATGSELIFIAGLPLFLALLYVTICNVRKRLHDMGLSGILSVFPFVFGITAATDEVNAQAHFISDALSSQITMISAILAIIIGLCLLFIPGTKGANRYGSSTNEYYGGKADLPKPKILEG